MQSTSVKACPDSIGDTSGAVTSRTRYKAFGEVLLTSNQETTGTLNTERKFTGQIFDTGTDLYFYNARYYDRTLRRFTQADTVVQSMSDPQALNRYSYAGNNPLLFVDPSGNCFVLAGVLAECRSDWNADMYARAVLWYAKQRGTYTGNDGGSMYNTLVGSAVGKAAQGIHLASNTNTPLGNIVREVSLSNVAVFVNSSSTMSQGQAAGTGLLAPTLDVALITVNSNWAARQDVNEMAAEMAHEVGHVFTGSYRGPQYNSRWEEAALYAMSDDVRASLNVDRLFDLNKKADRDFLWTVSGIQAKAQGNADNPTRDSYNKLSPFFKLFKPKKLR